MEGTEGTWIKKIAYHINAHLPKMFNLEPIISFLPDFLLTEVRSHVGSESFLCFYIEKNGRTTTKCLITD